MEFKTTKARKTLQIIALSTIFSVSLSAMVVSYPYQNFRDERISYYYAWCKNSCSYFDNMRKEFGDSIFFEYIKLLACLEMPRIILTPSVEVSADLDSIVKLKREFFYLGKNESYARFKYKNFFGDSLLDTRLNNLMMNLDTVWLRVSYVEGKWYASDCWDSLPNRPCRVYYNISGALIVPPSVNISSTDGIEEVKEKYLRWRDQVRNSHFETIQERSERLSRIHPPDSAGYFHRENYTDEEWAPIRVQLYPDFKRY